MRSKTSHTRKAEQLTDFLSDHSDVSGAGQVQAGTLQARPRGLINTVIPHDQQHMSELDRNKPDTCLYQGRIVEWFDTGENELYTR